MSGSSEARAGPGERRVVFPHLGAVVAVADAAAEILLVQLGELRAIQFHAQTRRLRDRHRAGVERDAATGDDVEYSTQSLKSTCRWNQMDWLEDAAKMRSKPQDSPCVVTIESSTVVSDE